MTQLIKQLFTDKIGEVVKELDIAAISKLWVQFSYTEIRSKGSGVTQITETLDMVRLTGFLGEVEAIRQRLEMFEDTVHLEIIEKFLKFGFGIRNESLYH